MTNLPVLANWSANIMKTRQEHGVNVSIITENPDNRLIGNPTYLMDLIRKLRSASINVGLVDSINEHYAVIDKSLVWHGGMNLLGRADVWDNLIRIRDAQAAAELLEISFSSLKNGSIEFHEHKSAPQL